MRILEHTYTYILKRRSLTNRKKWILQKTISHETQGLHYTFLYVITGSSVTYVRVKGSSHGNKCPSTFYNLYAMPVTFYEFSITRNRALVYTTTTTNMEDVDATRLAALAVILSAIREEERWA